MNVIHFDLLWQYVALEFKEDINGCHGLSHWKRVEKYGLRIARHSGADETVVRLFALFHDAMRINNDVDEDHSMKGAELVADLRKVLYTLNDTRFELLYNACRFHTDGHVSEDTTIGTCWDADRLDMWRVNMQPDERYMSTERGRKLAGRYYAMAALDPSKFEIPRCFLYTG